MFVFRWQGGRESSMKEKQLEQNFVGAKPDTGCCMAVALAKDGARNGNARRGAV